MLTTPSPQHASNNTWTSSGTPTCQARWTPTKHAHMCTQVYSKTSHIRRRRNMLAVELRRCHSSAQMSPSSKPLLC